jgi:tetratricopeptide (TPR) repeat protein
VNAENSGKEELASEAYELYPRGQFNRQLRSVAAIDRSIENFERALAIDPGSAPALAGLAGARFEQDILNGEFGASRAEVKRLTARAIDEDAALAEAYVELGRVFGYYDWDWDRAEAAFKRAIQLKPSLALAYSEYSFLLQAQARFEEAVVQAQKATAVDPRLPLAPLRRGTSVVPRATFQRSRRPVLACPRAGPWFHVYIRTSLRSVFCAAPIRGGQPDTDALGTVTPPTSADAVWCAAGSGHRPTVPDMAFDDGSIGSHAHPTLGARRPRVRRTR